MRPGLWLPLILLLAVAAGSVLIMIAARRERALRRRLEISVPVGEPADLTPQHGPSLRLRQARSTRFTILARLLKIPLDLPRANVIAPPAVIAITAGAAFGAFWLTHVLLAWQTSSLIGLVVWIVLMRGTFGWEVGRYQAKLVKQLPDTVQLVVSATRAGLPVTAAFHAVAEEMPSPTSDEFLRVDSELALGLPPEDALLNLHRRTGVTEYAIFAVTIGVQSRAGGRLAETIQNLADTVRERLAIAGRAKALAGEAQMSAIIMTALPLVTGGILAIVEPDQLAPLLFDPRGQHMLAFGVGSLIVGALTMRFMIRGATKE